MIEGITDKQALFNHVATHLIRQNGKSFGPRFACSYRGIDGKKCAAGCLLDDALYRSDLEGRSVFAREVLPLLNQSIGREIEGTQYCLAPEFHNKDIPDGCEIWMLQKLQDIHDGYEPILWKDELRGCAAEFGLQLPDCLKEALV